MSKFRFTSADVKAMVRDIRGSSVMGNRVVNIYDLSDKTYLFKFAVPGQEKVFLLMESGIRFHTTKYTRDIPDLPAPFTMKLRKILKTRRMEDVRQIGDDRVIDFKFGSGDSTNHVILELYANGNIILTDKNYEVLSLWRSHQFADDVTLRVGEIYPIAFSTSAASVKQTLVQAITSELQSRDIKSDNKSKAELLRLWANLKLADSEVKAEIMNERVEQAKLQGGVGGRESRKQAKRANKKLTLRQLLFTPSSGISWVGPDILDHCVLTAAATTTHQGQGAKPTMKIDQLLELRDDTLESLMTALSECERIMERIEILGQPGYIILQKPISGSEGSESVDLNNSDRNENMSYAEYVPLLLSQHGDKEHREFASFDEAVDEYYLRVEEQRLQVQCYTSWC